MHESHQFGLLEYLRQISAYRLPFDGLNIPN